MFRFLLARLALTLFAADLSAAPVPTYLMKPPPDPIVPGLVWRCGDYPLKGVRDYPLRVVRVEGDVVTIVVDGNPELMILGDHDLSLNQFRRSTVLKNFKDSTKPH